MLIHHDPDREVTVTERRTCPVHELNPDANYAGCTCSMSIRTRKATPEEYRAARLRRLRGERDRLQAELSSTEREIAALERDAEEASHDGA